MKRIFLLLLLLSFTACSAQKIDQIPLTKVNAFVQEKGEEVAKLQPSNTRITYSVPTGEFEDEKEYTFWLEVHQTTGRTRKASVVKYAMTTAQAQRDQAQAAKEVSHRKIIE